MADPIQTARQTAEAKKVLLSQADALGMEVDKRWSVDTLAEKVLEAQESAKDADLAAFAAAPKVWVFLLRDGWPVADERHNAGETIAVTQEIADKWYEAGVARPGKAPVA
jgi:hypothetical protein